ncbi:hypothetical protein MTR_5g075000 [Medicago truncatula]|uniref:Uncharacterized protein n=1 Tax=Medicago truncatula TaxID=3880 RepID=G7KFM5_MEDTR|nr:hypothetical protein MTR_5g075000 [Medicago truncatula]
MLGKWCWRMLVDRGGLWYRVLITSYGEIGGRLAVGVVLLGGGRWGGLGKGAVVLVIVGLLRVYRERWVMGLIHCSSAIGGLVYGGLRVGQLKEFNIVMLGKWCWRMLVDRGGLWYSVLITSYGEIGGRLAVRVVLLGGGRWGGLGKGRWCW